MGKTGDLQTLSLKFNIIFIEQSIVKTFALLGLKSFFSI